MANDIIDINVSETVDSVSITVNPNLTTVNINQVTGGLNQTLQSVTDLGSTTSNSITANSFIKSGGTGANVLLDNGSTTPLTSIVGTTNLTYTSGISNGVVNSNTGTDATIPLADSTNAGLFSATEKTKLNGIASGAEVNVNADWNAVSGDAEILNKPTGLATTTYVDNKDNSQQLQLNYLDRDNSIFDAFYLRTITDGSTVEASNQLLSSLAVLRNISYVNQGYTQQINADKFVKLGGAADEYLMADGSISYGGGGGGGATNLTTTQTISNFTINSNTGTDATVPLGNGTLAGATLNDYTTAEKNKLAGIATGAEVNVNADWNATSGDAQILNKPTIPSITNLVPYTGATTDVNLGLNDITAEKLIKSGGFDYQFLKADGSVDNNIYLTSADLPSTLDLYATTTASDISGYTVLVRNIADTRYNATAVDVSTGVITSVGQLVGSLITDANIISGNPGVFDFKTIGNISRTSGTGQAEFFFRIYKRNLAGTETLIAESDYTLPVTNGGYVEFSATALWNDGIFLDTDRVVLKYYANRLTSPVGSDPTYQFQFGGASPVRSSAAIPTSVMPNIYLRDLADVENVDALNNEILYWNDPASLWEHSLAENLVPLATATQKGLVSTTSQTFAGDKTFTGNTIISNDNIGLTTLYVESNSHIGMQVYGGGGAAAQFTADGGTDIVTFSGDNGLVAKVQNNGKITATAGTADTDVVVKSQLDAKQNTITLSAIGSVPNANAATLTGSVLNLQPASASFGGVVTTGDQTFAGAKTFSSIRFGATGSPVFFEYLGTPFFTSGTGATLNIGGGPGLAQNNLEVSNGTLKIGLQTASTIASFDANKNVVSLPLATYPSLTELTYVKGVTSGIQTQFSGKQDTLQSTVNIKSINGNSILGSGDLVISGSSAQTGTIIVTSGTSFTTPSTITTSTVFIIELVGGGGGGGGGPTGTSSSASGAGAGGYVFERITGLSPSTTYTCAIGTGGTGGLPATGGTSGTSTTLTIGAATFTASGGGFGTAAQSAAGGAGGTGSATGVTPDIVISGQNGGDSLNTAAAVPSGTGGSSPKGWGLGGSGVLANKNGYNATGYGAGGSGGKGVAASGGNGTQGIIYCQYFN
jgi:hypothetical protein